MSDNQMRHFYAEEKVNILKRHLLDRESVADICDELKISPNQFYRWHKDNIIAEITESYVKLKKNSGEL